MCIANKIGAKGHISMPKLYLLSHPLRTRVMLGSREAHMKDSPAERENKNVQEVQSFPTSPLSCL